MVGGGVVGGGVVGVVEVVCVVGGGVDFVVGVVEGVIEVVTGILLSEVEKGREENNSDGQEA